MEFARYLETNGGGFEKGSVNSLSCSASCSRSHYIFLGKVNSIGASNFSEIKLEEILQTAKTVPAVNQVNRFFSLHP